VQGRIGRGDADVICPMCGTRTLISKGVGSIRARVSDETLIALRTEIGKRAAEQAEKVKSVVAGTGPARPGASEPVRILHLSDLHFTAKTSPVTLKQALVNDVRNGDNLGFRDVEYLVISGDMTDRGGEVGFDKAREFVSLLVEEFRLSAQRCIFVPGNHDVQDLKASFDWYASPEEARKVERYETRWHKEGEVIFLPSADYPQRLKKFSDAFYHKVLQEPYPLEPERPVVAYLFPDTRIQFLALNSCWQIDGFHRK